MWSSVSEGLSQPPREAGAATSLQINLRRKEGLSPRTPVSVRCGMRAAGDAVRGLAALFSQGRSQRGLAGHLQPQVQQVEV